MGDKRFLLRSAVYLIPLKDKRVLLLRRFNTGWMDGKYSLIAGHLNGGETATQAMIREAKEEAGIIITTSDLQFVTVTHRKSVKLEYIDFFFVVKNWLGIPNNLEPDKCDELSWFSVNQLPENIVPSVREAIKNYLNKKGFSESGWNEAEVK